MAHVFILRQAVSFVEAPGAFYGTHEILERNINKYKFKFDGVRKGYNTPTCSEWKLLDYRIKKECIPEFLGKIGGVTNLNPLHLPKGFWFGLFLPLKLCKKMKLIPEHWYFGKLKLWLMLGCRLIPFLKSCDVNFLEEGETPLKEDYWCNNFVLGIINDIETEYGEEL